MARQEFTIGVPYVRSVISTSQVQPLDFSRTSTFGWNFDPGLLIDGALLEDADAVVRISRIRFYEREDLITQTRVYNALIEYTSGAQGNFSDKLARAAAAIEIRYADGYSFFYPGPKASAAAGVTATDNDAPYAWSFDALTPILTDHINYFGRFDVAQEQLTQLILSDVQSVRLAGELTGQGSSSSMVDVVALSVRMAGELTGEGSGSSEVQVENLVRLAGELTGQGSSSSMVSVVEPPDVRLAGELTAEGSGSSEVQVDSLVRLAGELTGQGSSSSMVSVVEPPDVRLAGELTGEGSGSSEVQSIETPAPRHEQPSFMVAMLLEFVNMPALYTGPTRFSSFHKNHHFEGKEWMGGAGIIQISPIPNDGTPTNRRATATIPLADEDNRRRLLNDWGSYEIEVGWLASRNNGATFERVPMRFKGRLSEPIFRPQESTLTVTIETYTGDIDRGNPLFWSNEAHQIRHPGDRFFEYTRELEQGKDVRWPP